MTVWTGVIAPEFTSVLSNVHQTGFEVVVTYTGYGESWITPHESLVGESTYVPGTFNAADWGGIKAPTFVDDFYNRIHFFPNPLNLGVLLNPQAPIVAVWNAYLIPVSLDTLTEEGFTGITTVSPGSIPQAFGALQQLDWQFEVSLDGPVNIAASIEFEFDVGTEILSITGTRAVILVYEPNWETPIEETLSWKTRIMKSYSGKETRSALTVRPRKAMSYSIDVFGKLEPIKLDAALFSFQNKFYGVPQWQDESPLTAAAFAGATTIYLSTDTYSFSVGASLFLYAGPTVFETGVITAIYPTYIELLNPIVRNWGAGSRVFPVQNGRFKEKIDFSRKGEQWLQANFSFDMSPQLTDPFVSGGSPLNTHASEEAWLLKPNWFNDVSHSQSYGFVKLDTGFGPTHYLDTAENANRQFGIPYLFLNRQMQLEFRRFLGRRRGMRDPFFVPSWTDDLTATDNVSSADTAIDFVDNGYGLYTELSPYRKHLYIETRQGQIFTREIVSSVSASGILTLGIDASLGIDVNVNNFKLVCFLYKARLASDSVKLTWLTSKVSTTVLPVEVVAE